MFFYVKTWITDPEVDSRHSGILGSTVDTYSASVFGCFWKNFIFSTLKDVPEVDSRPGAVRTGNLDIISTSSSYDVADGFFAAFCGIFRTPSAWT